MTTQDWELNNKLIRKFFLGFINIHILYHAQREPIYGKEFRKELERHGYSISYGTLYPILHSLEREGYLKREEKNVKGKIRKYYTITDKGGQVFNLLLKQVKELVNEVFN